MEMLNRATEDARAFADLLQKVGVQRAKHIAAAPPVSPEVAAWNAEVERKRFEKQARKAAAKVAP